MWKSSQLKEITHDNARSIQRWCAEYDAEQHSYTQAVECLRRREGWSTVTVFRESITNGANNGQTKLNYVDWRLKNLNRINNKR